MQALRGIDSCVAVRFLHPCCFDASADQTALAPSHMPRTLASCCKRSTRCLRCFRCACACMRLRTLRARTSNYTLQLIPAASIGAGAARNRSAVAPAVTRRNLDTSLLFRLTCATLRSTYDSRIHAVSMRLLTRQDFHPSVRMHADANSSCMPVAARDPRTAYDSRCMIDCAYVRYVHTLIKCLN